MKCRIVLENLCIKKFFSKRFLQRSTLCLREIVSQYPIVQSKKKNSQAFFQNNQTLLLDGCKCPVCLQRTMSFYRELPFLNAYEETFLMLLIKNITWKTYPRKID